MKQQKICIVIIVMLFCIVALPSNATYLCAGSATVKAGETTTITLASPYVRTLNQSTNITYRWYTDNSSYVKVTSYSRDRATIRGVQATNSGKIYFDCSYWIDGYFRQFQFYYDITVTSAQVKVHNIYLNHDDATLTEGETLQLNAYCFPTTATDQTVTWSRRYKDRDVVSVNSRGLVTALGPGTAVVSCEANDGSGALATCSITVKAKSPFSQTSNGTLKAEGTVTAANLQEAFTNYSNITALDLTNATLSSDITAETITTCLYGNIIAYLPENSKLSGTNIVSNGVCENLILSDGYTYISPPKTFVANTVTYSRKMKNEWGTIYLPYAFISGNGIELFKFTDRNESAVFVEKTDELDAKTPALIHKICNDSIITISTENVKIAQDSTPSVLYIVSSDELFGSFTQNKKITNANSYYLKNDKFVSAKNYFYVDAFRAYLSLYITSSTASHSFSIITDDLSSINDAKNPSNSKFIVGIYSVNGVKLSGLRCGVNIVKYSDGSSIKIIR